MNYIYITSNTSALFITLNDLAASAPYRETTIRQAEISQISLSSDEKYIHIVMNNGTAYYACALPIWVTLSAGEQALYYPIEKLNGSNTVTNVTLFASLQTVLFPA